MLRNYSLHCPAGSAGSPENRRRPEISEKLDALPEIFKDDGYPDTSSFMKTYREMESVAERYERDMREYNAKLKQKERPADKPPEPASIRKRLRQLHQQGKQQPHKKNSFDRDSR